MRTLILFTCLILSFQLRGQKNEDSKISFKIENVLLTECLDQLSEQSGIPIGYSSQLFDNTNFITLDIKKTSFTNILKTILKDSNVDFKKIDNQFVLFIKDKPYTLSGHISDKQSGEKLFLASIYCHNNQKGTYANENGYFSLVGNDPNFNIEIKYIGYETSLLEVDAKSTKNIQIELTSNVQLSDIIIIPENFKSFAPNDPYQGKPITNDIVKVSPSLAGEADHIRSSQAIAGVSSANDGLSGLQIRGGESGQNLMLIDGVPVYLPYHLLGAYSIYNPNLVRSAKLINGYFPARYGGRTSSVFDIWMKDGHNEEYHSQFEVNLNNLKLHFEGPIKNDKGSFIIGGRLAPRNFLFEPIYKKTYFQTSSETITSNFNDLNIKVNYKLNPKNTVTISLLNANDNFNSTEDEEIENEENEIEFNWNNIIGSLHLNSILSKKLFLRTSLSMSFLRL